MTSQRTTSHNLSHPIASHPLHHTASLQIRSHSISGRKGCRFFADKKLRLGIALVGAPLRIVYIQTHARLVYHFYPWNFRPQPAQRLLVNFWIKIKGVLISWGTEDELKEKSAHKFDNWMRASQPLPCCPRPSPCLRRAAVSLWLIVFTCFYRSSFEIWLTKIAPCYKKWRCNVAKYHACYKAQLPSPMYGRTCKKLTISIYIGGVPARHQLLPLPKNVDTRTPTVPHQPFTVVHAKCM